LPEPLFSVVVVCYNQENFIREAVESALSQDFSSREVIVVDDASSDATSRVLESFGESIIFARLAKNGGAPAARNHGASLASGKYLVFLDGDDVLLPGALDVYARLVTARSPKLIFGRCNQSDANTPEAPATVIPVGIQFVEYANFLSKDRPCVFNTSTFVVDRSTFLTAGGWSPEIFYQDIQDLVTKMEVAGKTILVLAPSTVWYRMHANNSAKKILPFVDGVHVLLAKAKADRYPGGRKHWAPRSAWFGGLVFYWTKTAIRARLYRNALALLASGWWMILFAMARRGTAWLVGRKRVEFLSLA
jgi:glycosyltransferase involved in cell wall biosynthesis